MYLWKHRKIQGSILRLSIPRPHSPLTRLVLSFSTSCVSKESLAAWSMQAIEAWMLYFLKPLGPVLTTHQCKDGTKISVSFSVITNIKAMCPFNVYMYKYVSKKYLIQVVLTNLLIRYTCKNVLLYECNAHVYGVFKMLARQHITNKLAPMNDNFDLRMIFSCLWV